MGGVYIYIYIYVFVGILLRNVGGMVSKSITKWNGWAIPFVNYRVECIWQFYFGSAWMGSRCGVVTNI